MESWFFTLHKIEDDSREDDAGGEDRRYDACVQAGIEGVSEGELEDQVHHDDDDASPDWSAETGLIEDELGLAVDVCDSLVVWLVVA